MKDSKPFFFRIDLTELYDFATEPEGMKMSLLKFAKELKKGQSDYPQIQKIIDEAHEFIAKKSASGKKAMEIRYKDKPKKQKKANTVITPLSTVITQPNDDITRSSSSNNSSTETETITEEEIKITNIKSSTAWFAFKEMRKKIKKPLTPHAEELALKELLKLEAKGNKPEDVLDRSTMNCWQGLFEIKNNNQIDSRFDGPEWRSNEA